MSSSRKVSVVIDANWGDAGKGLIADYLASKADKPLVIRFNGGAQAGHTVVTPEGKRHVFSHFGSGTLAHAPSHLDYKFIINPIMFMREYKALTDLGLKPNISADYLCHVTTPYDMMLNQAVENHRGKMRHGSCGVGIFETILRSDSGYSLTYSSLQRNPRDITSRLEDIRTRWVPRRCAELGIDIKSLKYLHDLGMMRRFLDDWHQMLEICVPGALYTTQVADPHATDWIFEGAQGLMLDQDRKDMFPHVTPSKTGFSWLTRRGLASGEVDVYYVTRTYTTRHGAGPLPCELPKGEYPYPGVEPCKTNKDNEFQGSLRYGLIDFDILVGAIKEDLAVAHENGCKTKAHLAITHADQSDGMVKVCKDGSVIAYPCDSFAHDVLANVTNERAGGYLISRGPTRSDITSMKFGYDVL